MKYSTLTKNEAKEIIRKIDFRKLAELSGKEGKVWIWKDGYVALHTQGTIPNPKDNEIVAVIDTLVIPQKKVRSWLFNYLTQC